LLLFYFSIMRVWHRCQGTICSLYCSIYFTL